MKAIENIKNFYKSREKVIKLYYGYDKMRSEAKHKSKQAKRLKKLTPKQMLQRLPIALARVRQQFRKFIK